MMKNYLGSGVNRDRGLYLCNHCKVTEFPGLLKTKIFEMQKNVSIQECGLITKERVETSIALFLMTRNAIVTLVKTGDVLSISIADIVISSRTFR